MQTQQQPVPEKKGVTKKQVKIVFLLLLAGLAALIIGMNAHPVNFWLFKNFENASLIVLMIISMLLGAILSWVIISVRASRKRSETTRLRNEIKKLQDELTKSSQRLGRT